MATEISIKPASIKDVVQNGLCIGCGLCESVTERRVPMRMTDYGALRPASVEKFSEQEERVLLNACPGAGVEAPKSDASLSDLVWGKYEFMRYAWAGDPEVRFKSATGGVLTALAQFLVKNGLVEFVLHVNADPDNAMRNRWVMSSSESDVLANSGSRYAPTAPLAGLSHALEREVPFVFVGKPCDVSALNRLAKDDARIDQYCTHRLALVCGGQSRLSKTLSLVTKFGVQFEDVASISYRGYGNPGPTLLTTRSGQEYSSTYDEQWADTSSWDLESRCTLCADALGEAADIAAADVWPGGGPDGEDEGFNGVVVRTQKGRTLFREAVNAGALAQGEFITPRQFDHFQPHQVSKKVALFTRFKALAECGKPAPEALGLRLELLDKMHGDMEKKTTYEGTVRRAKAGRFTEP